MNFIKAAASAAIAAVICSCAAISAAADTFGEIIGTDGQGFEFTTVDASQDAEYLKYRHELFMQAASGNSPAGRIKSDFPELCAFGSYLTHDSRFDGMDRDFCIDVSQWQSYIDWKAVKASGIDNCIIRLGVRGYGSAGTLMIDDRYFENIRNAKAAGMNVGVYFYTQAISEAEAREEADYCAAALKDYSLELPVYYDIESVDYDYGRLDHAGLSYKQKTALCSAFCDRIESYGYQSGVYANLYWLTSLIDGPSLGMNYKTWVAAYLSSINYGGIYDMWQYSSQASIDGIYGNVDISVMYDVDYSPTTALKAELDGKKLSWNKANGADGYTVYGSNDGSSFTAAGDAEGCSFDITGSNYSFYRVAAYNYFAGKRHYGHNSNNVAVKTYSEMTEGLSVKRSGIDRVMLSWQPTDGAASYEVYTTDGSSTNLVGNTAETSFEISGKNLQEFRAYVRPYNADGIGGKVSEEIELPANTPSGVPSLERVGTKLVWTKVEDADGYIVTFSGVSGIEETRVDGNSFYMDEERDGTYYVQAYIMLEGRKFRSEASNTIEFKGISYPPKGELVLDAGDGELVWNKIDDAQGYVVYEISADGEEIAVAVVNGCRYATDKLTGTVYSVRAYNSKDGKDFYTDMSNKVVVSLPEVTEAKLESFSGDTAIISWDGIEDCDEYRVYVDLGKGYKLYTSVKGTMAVIAGLKDAEFASVRVKGYSCKDDVVSYGAFSNQLYIIGTEDSRPQQEVFSFEDLLK